jgi:hypothetical protein
LNYPGPQQGPLELARRASLFLFILGGLIALLGVLNCAVAFTFSGEEIIRQNQPMLPTTQSTGGLQLSPSEMRIGAGIAGAVELVIGLGLMLLGSPVRRAQRWAVTTGIVAVCIIGGFALIMLLGCLLIGIAAPPMLAMACVLVIPMTLCVLLVKWLIQVMQGLRPVSQPYAGPIAGAMAAPPSSPPWPQPGPAPFSGSQLPRVPPGGERPVRYGYAQAPIVPQPPPGEAPIGPAPDPGNIDQGPKPG